MQLSKIELLLHGETVAQIFQVGQHAVESISLIENPEQITITFQKDNDWNYELIPFSSIKTLRYTI